MKFMLAFIHIFFLNFMAYFYYQLEVVFEMELRSTSERATIEVVWLAVKICHGELKVMM